MSECTATRLGVLGLAMLITAACGGDVDAPRLGVQPAVELPDSVAVGEPLDMGYRWQLAEDFAPSVHDYQVLVHLLGPDGEIVLQDDHHPPEPTSQWSRGRGPAYRRWVYLPEELGVEFLDVLVGLYSADGPVLVWNGEDWTERVRVRRLEIRTDDTDGLPRYLDGWHTQEEAPESLVPWRWTEDVAHTLFTNPDRDAVLHLRASAPYDQVGAQTVMLRIQDREVGRFETTSAEEFLERIAIPASAMGERDWFELTLEVSPVFVPEQVRERSRDERTLGLQVFSLYLFPS